MKISELYQYFLKFPKISTDSRNIAKGSIFFALKGENFNGNKYAKQAIENGASIAVIDEDRYVENEQYLLCDNVLETLQNLAKHHRKELKTKVIAITGTNGKTTTKELIHAVLSKKYNVKSTIGNFNNHIGVPLTILSISENHEFAVVEMGANHIGEIKFLCEIAKPNFGIITNVGKAHLEGFGSFEGVKKAKQELYSYIRGIKGKVFINYDNDVLTKLMLNQEKVTFGTRQKYFCFGETIYSNPFLKISWNQQNVAKSIQTNLIGEYNFENVMSAICIADYFGVAENDIVHAIENYFPTNNRSQYIETDNNTIILDAYNANPTSMAAAIINFNKINFANKTLIIGDMLELGKSSSIEHSKIIDLVKSFTFSKIYLVGMKFYEQKIPDNFNRFLNVEELISFIKQAPLSSSLILIKASRGIKLELIKDIL